LLHSLANPHGRRAVTAAPRDIAAWLVIELAPSRGISSSLHDQLFCVSTVSSRLRN
jgi:hypothetical protein